MTISELTNQQRQSLFAKLIVKRLQELGGDELVRLVKKYQLYIYPVTTYELDDFCNVED